MGFSPLVGPSGQLRAEAERSPLHTRGAQGKESGSCNEKMDLVKLRL